MQEFPSNERGAGFMGFHGSRPASRGIVRFATILGLVLATLVVPAFADESEDSVEAAYWQDRYRDLLAEARQLRVKIERERELYAAANRRNYRRGQKRHVHRQAREEAAKELARVEAQLATIEDDARRDGAPRGWLNSIEIELEDAARRPEVGAGPGEDGRNPLYLKSKDREQRRGSKSKSEERHEGRNPLHLD